MDDCKLIINAALTGIIPTRDQTPHVPITPAEIAREAKQVYDLGAGMVHIHARDKEGNPTSDKEVYREIILRIREKCEDMVIIVSTSGRRAKSLHERLAVIELDGDAKPDMASLTLGSLNFRNDVSITHPRDLLFMLQKITEAGLKPELEIFDAGMANYAMYLFDQKYLRGRHYANLILGSLGTMPANPKSLFHLVDGLPETCLWAATGIGRTAFQVQCLAIAAGGHVRVGIEDGIYLNRNKELATNAALVRRVQQVAEAMGREIMTAAECRALLFVGQKQVIETADR
jgi:3-keto-5-aminohexanoate cleavage enzyme